MTNVEWIANLELRGFSMVMGISSLDIFKKKGFTYGN